MAPCWNGHREAHATSAQNTRNNGTMCTYMRYGWEGLGGGGGIGVGLPMVSRVSL